MCVYIYIRIQLTKICIRLFPTKSKKPLKPNPTRLRDQLQRRGLSSDVLLLLVAPMTVQLPGSHGIFNHIDIHINLWLSMWPSVQIYIHLCEYVFWKWPFLFCWTVSRFTCEFSRLIILIFHSICWRVDWLSEAGLNDKMKRTTTQASQFYPHPRAIAFKKCWNFGMSVKGLT